MVQNPTRILKFRLKMYKASISNFDIWYNRLLLLIGVIWKPVKNDRGIKNEKGQIQK